MEKTKTKKMKTLYIREALTSKRTTKSKLKAIVMIYYHFGGLRSLFFSQLWEFIITANLSV